MTAVAGAGHTLTDVIASGDACNHAIFTDEELAVGVGRLVASGLMQHATPDRLKLTPAGVKLARRRKGGLIEQVGSVLRLLGSVELVEGRWDVQADSIAAAVRAYQDRSRRR
ncbi:hypothetical protein AB1046_08950 [Promicromonospora sp. Populi]|uniref:hypothetical protein n=1 Tax=Promicromonospora sp. Populi TaxID=3239420 RepID=UPI0034E1CC78